MADLWGSRRKFHFALLLAQVTIILLSFMKNGHITATSTVPLQPTFSISINSTPSSGLNSTTNPSSLTSVASTPSLTTVSPSVRPSSGCPDGVFCSDLGASCIDCQYNDSCVYGEEVSVSCKALDFVDCKGPRNFTKTFSCRYCFQTPEESYHCIKKTTCKVVSAVSDPPRYITNCTVKEEVLCLGNRTFNKLLRCNWTSGYRWSTAVLLRLSYTWWLWN
ncbi:TM2 domain-containing protein 3 isoform X2 [Nematostella vectensis]|uniref:TM2 domain-containing protein 3 isoform X2 n=1 Tax=Nematostella vectensis TaxID=45351 RepID=UPI0020772782|nr:TM2 domain-containing protein 3 isoform X2 [Nematostella vectensis]